MKKNCESLGKLPMKMINFKKKSIEINEINKQTNAC